MVSTPCSVYQFSATCTTQQRCVCEACRCSAQQPIAAARCPAGDCKLLQ
jgi:hypothetical protein